MCLIIYKPKDKELSDSAVRRGFMSNSNGAGLMYSKDGKLVVEKGIFNVEAVLNRIRAIEAEYDTHICIHFRLATSGEHNQDNCHPFKINDNLAVMHNGVFGHFSYANTLKSDTWLFTEEVLQALPDGFLATSGARFLLEKYCKAELSKLVFMDNLGTVNIINEQAGSWTNGLWYSSGYYGGIYKYKYGEYNNGREAWDDEWEYENHTSGRAYGNVWQKCDCCAEFKSNCMKVSDYLVCEGCWNTVFSTGRWCTFCGHQVSFDIELICPICHTENSVLDLLCQNDYGGVA